MRQDKFPRGELIAEKRRLEEEIQDVEQEAQGRLRVVHGTTLYNETLKHVKREYDPLRNKLIAKLVEVRKKLGKTSF